jgi:hypothetical protein
MLPPSYRPFDLSRPLQIVSPLEEWCGADEAGMRASFQNLIDMGVSGIVTNVKLEKYLVDEASWEVLRRGVKLAHEMGLRVWIYDEKGYPSGAAGGLVLEQYPGGEAEGLIRAFGNNDQPKYDVVKLFEKQWRRLSMLPMNVTSVHSIPLENTSRPSSPMNLR